MPRVYRRQMRSRRRVASSWPHCLFFFVLVDFIDRMFNDEQKKSEKQAATNGEGFVKIKDESDRVVDTFLSTPIIQVFPMGFPILFSNKDFSRGRGQGPTRRKAPRREGQRGSTVLFVKGPGRAGNRRNRWKIIQDLIGQV